MNAQSNRPVGAGTVAKVIIRTVKIDGLDIFYHEVRPKDATTVLLVHCFPTSSHMKANGEAWQGDQRHG